MVRGLVGSKMLDDDDVMQCTDFLTAVLEGRGFNYATDMCLVDLTWTVVSFLETLDGLVVMIARLCEATNQVVRFFAVLSLIAFCRYINFSSLGILVWSYT